MIRKAKDGGITVFLSMILLLVLAIVGTVIEAARVNVSKIQSERALQIAMDTIFTEYNLPLYQDFHLLFMDSGDTSKNTRNDSLEMALRENMQYTLEPNYNLYLGETNYKIPNSNFLQISTSKVELSRITKATDYNGDIFVNEAVEYMKYDTGTNVLKLLMQQINLVEETKETSSVMQKKLKAEESLADLNGYMMELMELIEGISFGKNGLKYTSSGHIKTEKYFVKQMAPEGVSSDALGIDHKLVWDSLKNKYMYPITILDHMEQNLMSIQNIQDEEEVIRLQTAIYEEKNKLTFLADKIVEKIDASLAIIPKLEEKQNLASKEIMKFENALLDKKDGIAEEIFQSMQEDLHYMQEYVGKESRGNIEESMLFRLKEMKSVLEKNRVILRQIIEMKHTSFEELGKKINEIRKALREYKTKSLKFDYSSLIIKPGVKSPMGSLNKMLKKGMLSLVVADTNTISKKFIAEVNNLYYLHCHTDPVIEKENELDKDYGNYIKNSDEEGYNDAITTSFDDYKRNCDFGNLIKEGGMAMTKNLLLGEYIGKHFKNYLNQDTQKIKRDTALEYEKECIIMGKNCDYDNFEGIVIRLIFIRTIANFLYVMSDREKGNMAYATAAALVGFTCLEPLVRITKTLILVVWAFVEALVDTGATLEGKRLPLMKGKNDFRVTYTELLLVNKVLIQNKIKEVPEKSKSKVDLGYDDYLKLFIVLLKKEVKSYRPMELIQENIRLNYQKNFSIEECIYGLQATVQWKVPSKFTQLPFVNQVLEEKKEYWNIIKTLEYSY